jgi:hypothetical protein
MGLLRVGEGDKGFGTEDIWVMNLERLEQEDVAE